MAKLYELVSEPLSNSSEETWKAYEELDSSFRDVYHVFTREQAERALTTEHVDPRGFNNLLRQGSIQEADEYAAEMYRKGT